MPSSPKTVLIVDDNPTVRSVLRTFLSSRANFVVVGEAANGADAVERAKQFMPNVVLIDLSMPMLNGLEASSIIKGALPFTTIVMFTMFGDAVSEKLAKASGVDIVVGKEKGVDNLTKALENLLSTQLPS